MLRRSEHALPAVYVPTWSDGPSSLPRDIRRIVIARTMDIYKMAVILGSDLDERLIGAFSVE